MRIFLFFFLFFIATLSFAQKKKPVPVLSFGLDYRMYPIDIEDAPRGPLPRSTFGELTDFDFWKVLSIQARLGIKTKKNWLFSLVGNTRYNHNHFLEDPFTPSGSTGYYYNEKTKNKEKIKFDVFIDLEKKIRIRKNKERFLTILTGLRLTNINSQADITYRRNNNTGGTTNPIRYKGSYLHFGPKLSLGYQYKKIKSSLDGYFIKDPLKTNLTSLWIGATISYEMPLKKNTGKTEIYKKPDVAVYYKQSITRKKIGLVLLAPSAILFLLGRMNLDVKSSSYGNDRSGFTYTGVVTGGTSLYCLISSRHQLKKAERKNNNPAY